MPKYIPKCTSTHAPKQVKDWGKPFLMAPAGDWDCVKAAVENGADAIYFGLDRFNARMRANNFTVRDLPELMEYLHYRGVKGYVTFNTLVFTEELTEASNFLKSIIGAGVDAAIVQDIGMCRMIREISPDFPIHASTQMSITSEAGLRFAKELDVSLTVLARECSLDEIEKINQNMHEKQVEMPIEAFVHGALCVAYSGQCLTSEALGGRSANRGECAQACRLPFELYEDDERIHLGAKRYLLSPQDLSGVELLPKVIKSGIQSLKIEGRLKSPEYVAAVTQVYRRALDLAWESRLSEEDIKDIPKEDHYQLEMTFSRGLDSGWMEGINNQRLVHARFGKKRGVRLGIVDDVSDRGIWIEAEADVKAGDGVVFDSGRPDIPEEGGRIKYVDEHRGALFLQFQSDSVKLERVKIGQAIYKTSDPALDKQLRKSYDVEKPSYCRPVDMIVSGKVGEVLTLEVFDAEDRRIIVESGQVIIEAEKRPLDDEVLKKQLSRLGSTPYFLRTLDNRLEENCMLPMSALNQIRREAIAELDRKRKQPLCWQLNKSYRPNVADYTHPVAQSSVGFIPYVRSWDQFEAVLDLPYKEIYIELENPRDYKQAVQQFKAHHAGSGEYLIWVAPPRVFKTGENWIIEKLLECGADGYLVRNHEHLSSLQGQRIRGDFSLNVANPLTAEWLTERWDLERLTASYDLNHNQLMELLKHSPFNRFEITLHQHMPMFHMEHCVFCAFLTKGKDFRDCGRPCDTRSLSLKDRTGMLHPVKADAGCRNTVFNAKAQTGAEYLNDFIRAGAQNFRIEFLNETADELIRTMDRYEKLLHFDISSDDLWTELKLLNQLGVTRGSLKEN